MSICCSHRGFSTSVIGAVSFLVLGCPSSTARKAQLTAPIAMKGVDKELDTGHISVHAAVAREVPFGEERLTFGQLTDAVRIFSLLQGSNQASRLKSTYSSFSAGASVSSPLLESLAISETSNRETKSTESTSGSSTTADGKTSTESTSTALGDDSLRLGGGREAVYKSPELVPAPAGVLGLPSGPSATAATPYELFYATAETLLAARSLEHLYNVADAPDGYTLFSIPLVATFEPGRITRTNYTGESVLVFDPADAKLSMRMLAVAPAGLSSFASSSLSELSRLQFSLGAGVPIGAAALELQAGAVRDAMDAFTSMARRPDLQVSIAGDTTLVIRYLGRETFEGGVALSPVSFNMEVLALIKFDDSQTSAVTSRDARTRFQIAAAGERPAPPSAVREIKMAKTSRFKPAFASESPARPRSAEEVTPVDATSVPTYSTAAAVASTSIVTVYVPSKPTRIDAALYYPDGRILLNGAFQPSTCTCLELFAGAETAKTDLIPQCRWTKEKAASYTFDVEKGKYPDAKQKENLVGRISFFSERTEGECRAETLAKDAPRAPDRVAALPIKLASPPPKSPTPPGSAVLKSVSGTLDDLGATLFLEYTGDASDPLVLVDGQTAPRTRLEVSTKKVEKTDTVTGGRVWLRIPGRHDAKLMEKTYILSVGSGTETKETRLVVAKR